jgi:uncharacterized membrane protein (DUF373 family)
MQSVSPPAPPLPETLPEAPLPPANPLEAAASPNSFHLDPGGRAWHQLFRRPQLVQSLEAVQDLIAVSLCLGLFCVMALQLQQIFTSLLQRPEFHAITADILFILILVELFRLLIIYLQEQRVSIGVSVEIAIVSVLREVIVRGVLETDWRQILAVCLFLATAALLMVVRVWLPPTFEGVDPEAKVSALAIQRHHGSFK